MASSIRKLFKSKQNSTSATTINSREIITKLTSFNQEISKNHLPHINPETIYEIGIFDFKTVYSIKEHEQTISLQNEFEEIKLLSSIALEKYKNKGFNYIHFGLIQIAIKPLSRVGIDSPILMLLRDRTLLKFEDSLLGAVQTNLCNGAVYFNCAPNFQVSLHDPTILNTLVLNVHLPEIKFQNERHGYLLLYRIYFKQSTSEFNPRCLLQDSKGETTILAAHSKDTPTATYVPKQLKWTEITVPDQWKIKITQPPRNFKQKNISRIIEEQDGKILLRFGSFREPTPPRISSYYSNNSIFKTPSRASFSIYRTRPSSTEPEAESSNPNQNNPIKFKAPIAEPESNVFPTSPTQSDFNSINVISKKFEINKEYLKKDFYSKENNEKREWYFKTFSKQQVIQFRKIWYTEMTLKEINIPFFTWFEQYSTFHNFDYIFKTINVSSSLSQVWEQTDGKKIKTIHPPLADLKIQTPSRQLLATPFKTGANDNDNESVTKQDIKNIYQQNNYQSQILYTIAKQVDNIDDKISNEEKALQHPFSSIAKPIFKPIDREVKLPDNEILKSISSRLDSLNKGKGIHNIDEDDNESIQTSESEGKKLEQEINRIKNRNVRSKKPYYRKHTPPDLLFEEHHKYSGNIYTGEGIYEWNIDGRSEYEIMNLFQEMGMAAIAYKARGNTDKQACILIITGFTGALKYWWDNSLDRITQDYIIDHVEKIRIGQDDGFYEIGEKQNAVEVLIHTLTMHFIGNPAEELESKKLILTNLRCPTLGDFKWYKDVFVTNIFQRKDCNQSFWKERFISGLPTFFA